MSTTEEIGTAITDLLLRGEGSFVYRPEEKELVCTTFDGMATAKADLDDVLDWLVEFVEDPPLMFPRQTPARGALNLASVHVDEDLATGRNPYHTLRNEWVLLKRLNKPSGQ